jgi:hypothetical protein
MEHPGCQLTPANLSPLQVVQSVLSALGGKIRRTDADIVSFGAAIQWIIELAVRAPTGPSHFCGDASGSQILARLSRFVHSLQCGEQDLGASKKLRD